MGYSYFRLRLLGRVLLLTLTLAVLVYGFFYRHWYVTSACLLVLAAAQVYSLAYFVEKSNRELARLLASIRHADFTQSFNDRERSASFRHLYGEFNQMIQAFQQIKSEKEAHHLYLQTLVEHVDIGLLSVNGRGEAQLLNRAGREMLGVPLLHHVGSLGRISPALEEAVREMGHGESRMIRHSWRGEPLLLNLRSSELVLQGEPLRIVSVQNIRSELEEQESEAWQKLIRVLTHEVMNSVTPIISLTATIRTLVASGLGREAVGERVDQEVLADIQTGLQTIEKRSRGMLHFVESYRRLTRIPPPRLERVAVGVLFAEVDRLLSAELEGKAVDLRMHLPEKELLVHADPALMVQVLLNLIKNAVEACAGRENPQIEVKASLFGTFNDRVRIEVRDNGPGIPAEVLDKIFVPFYTTKKDGSGIGLPLSRQIMRLHKGALQLTSTQPGHTVFSLLFGS